MDASVLRAKYPRLIPERFGFEFHEDGGWLGLLDDFFAVVDRVLPTDVPFQLLQVKEKFGGLRIYYHIDGVVPDAVSNEIRDALVRADARSEHTCEVCGKRGSPHRLGTYILTVCEEHAEVNGRVAIPETGRTSIIRTNSTGFQRYDFDMDAFVPCDPPEGW